MNLNEKDLLEALFCERVLALAIKMADASKEPKPNWEDFVPNALGAIDTTRRIIGRLHASSS